MFNLLLITVAIVGGILFTYLAKILAIHIGFVSKPNPIVPQHTEPIAYLGGGGIFGGLVIGIISAAFSNEGIKVLALNLYVIPILFGSIAFLSLGLFDDLRACKPFSKLLLQIITGIICILLGLKGNFTNIYAVDIILTLFWMLLVINAANLIDVCDGLLAGVVAVTFLVIGFFFPALTAFCYIVSGSIIGFLCFNFPPASIFLGDAGSHLLGFLLAAIGILQSNNINHLSGLIWMAIIVAVPIFELLFITVMRIRVGIPWWKGSPDHFSLRLQSIGFSKVTVNLISWSISLICSIAACSFLIYPIGIKLTICGALLLISIIVWRSLAKIEVKRSSIA